MARHYQTPLPTGLPTAVSMDVRNSLEQFCKLKVSPVQRFDDNPAGLFPQIDRVIHPSRLT